MMPIKAQLYTLSIKITCEKLGFNTHQIRKIK